MKNRLIKNTFSLTFIQVANYIVPLIVLVHLARVLGPDVYGILAFGQAIIVMSNILTDFGYSLSATNKIAETREDSEYVSGLIGGIYVVKIFLFLICAAGLTIFSFINTSFDEHALFLYLTLIPIFVQSFFPLWFFQGIERMHYLALILVIVKVIYVLTIIIYVQSPVDYILVPILYGVSQLVGVTLSIFMIYKLGYRLIIPSLNLVRFCYKFSKEFFFSRIGVMIYMNSSVLVLGLVANPSTVAIYSIAEQLYKAMQSAISPLSAALYPFMSKEKEIKLMLKLINYCIIVVAFGAFIGYFIAPIIIDLLFDDSWKDSINILNIFFIAVIIHAAAVMTGYPLAAALGRIDVANSSVLTGAIVYSILISVLLYLNQITPINLALLMIISEVCVLIHRSGVLIPLAKERVNQ